MNLDLMRKALELARNGKGRVLSNPCVGSVVVKNGEIIGEGWHKFFGGCHAEVEAFNSSSNSLLGADLYVTLEPCCHTGKTPPCVEAILKSGISRVFVGMLDPSAKVNGKGVNLLREHGVQVFVCEDEELVREIRLLNQEFVKNNLLSLPYVVMKAAVTLDGKIATAGGESRYITEKVARDDAHLERSYCDAVLVGAGTVRNDDPELATFGDLSDKNICRVVVGNVTDLSLDFNFFRDSNFVYFVRNIDDTSDKYVERGGKVVEFSSWRDILNSLFEMGFYSVFIEGGAGVFGSLYDEFLTDSSLIDKVLWYVSPKIIGGGGVSVVSGDGVNNLIDSKTLSDMKASVVGNDIKIEGYLNFR